MSLSMLLQIDIERLLLLGVCCFHVQAFGYSDVHTEE